MSKCEQDELQVGEYLVEHEGRAELVMFSAKLPHLTHMMQAAEVGAKAFFLVDGGHLDSELEYLVDVTAWTGKKLRVRVSVDEVIVCKAKETVAI